MVFRWSFRGILVGLVWLAGMWAIWTWMAIDVRRRGRREKPRPAHCAVILGAYTNGYRPSATLRNRLRAGLHLYRLGYVSYFIVSGGRGEDETVSESRSMKRFLMMNGVPPHAILEDRHSTDTWENLGNSLRVMQEHGLKSAVIVTSDYHLPRALAVAKVLGMDASGYAAWSNMRDLRVARREVLARVLYVLRGKAVWVRKGRIT
ncbi:hypothetical protein GCM10025857_35260 [Alicyclobacillus contaminans]|nr:YdcF family protein [Alicyclobacillus contaminans]GMA52169.1 hypothetical protein GCM10025857_35260 [Alicyclobacillus contaminans]